MKPPQIAGDFIQPQSIYLCSVMFMSHSIDMASQKHLKQIHSHGRAFRLTVGKLLDRRERGRLVWELEGGVCGTLSVEQHGAGACCVQRAR